MMGGEWLTVMDVACELSGATRRRHGARQYREEGRSVEGPGDRGDSLAMSEVGLGEERLEVVLLTSVFWIPSLLTNKM